ncbi:MAG: dihydrodipicolinate synthase family protein [Planctomycetaceae bacterium]|nr:dihydrodipicolinate synthase family protein [Planctomycetaceae bacterium]
MTTELIEQLHGIVSPVITPLNENRTFDAGSAARLYSHLLEIGINGFFLFGSSGEGPLLNSADRHAALKTAVEIAGGRIPVLAAVLEPGTDLVIEQGRAARDLGADALVVCPPFYYPGSQADVLRHFRAVNEAFDIPIIAYDIPSTTKIKIQLSTMLTLASEGTIIAAKDSSPDFVGFRRLLEKRPEGFKLFTGAELLVDAALSHGADGTVSGLANVAPEQFVQMYDLWRAGRQSEAIEIQNALVRIFDVFLTPEGSLETGSAIGAMKTAMKLRGLIDHNTLCRPFAPVTSKQEERTRRIMTEAGLL